MALLTPASRGTVRLASAEPAAAPIGPGYLTDPRKFPRLRGKALLDMEDDPRANEQPPAWGLEKVAEVLPTLAC